MLGVDRNVTEREAHGHHPTFAPRDEISSSTFPLQWITCAPAAQCPADIDGSGTIDAADLAAVLGAWGACSGCAADVNGSGTVDASDLAAVLGGWGVCP